MRYMKDTETVLLRASQTKPEVSDERALIQQTELTLDQHGFTDFLMTKLSLHSQNLIDERQSQLLHNKLKEMINERAVCEMMLASISEVPNQK